MRRSKEKSKDPLMVERRRKRCQCSRRQLVKGDRWSQTYITEEVSRYPLLQNSGNLPLPFLW